MNIPDKIWVDLIGTALALVFVNGALTGKFYSHGKGGRRKLIAQVRSSWTRLFLVVIAAIFVVWVCRDLLQKFAA